MAVLDNAVWINGSTGFAENGSTVISEGGNSTTVTGSFSANGWDATSNGTNVSDFGAAFITAPINATWGFSNPVEDLSFTLEHVSSSGTTYDDEFTLYIYDDNGDLIPAAAIIAAISGNTNVTIYANPDGSVVVEADNTTEENITFDLTGYQVSQVNITFDVGPDGTQTGGAGISDFSFSVPPEPDFIVEGTAGNDTIDATYVGDPEGDRVDNLDHSDGSNNDSITAGAGDDSVVAGAGNDTVYGSDGADTLLGGDGNDYLDGDNAFAAGAADSISGGAGNDTIIGDVGDDTLSGGSGADVIYSGTENDSVSGGGGADTLYGEDGDDTLDGGGDNDSIYGNAGEDTFLDSAGDDLHDGGDGRDTFVYTTLTGNDTVVGGEVNDTAPINSGDRLDFHDGTDGMNIVFTGDEEGTATNGTNTITFSEIEHINGGQGSDTLDASASNVQQILDGGEGADTIQGGSGDDIIATGMTQDFGATDGDNDTIILVDGFGNDSIEGFETPTDLGGGNYTGNDQVDVTGLTDTYGNPVNTSDVTVSDSNGDGTGDAILTFPNGESITLWGVNVSAVSSDAQLEAIGIPNIPPNYIVEGTAAGEVINAGYGGDPEGDKIDNNDHSDGSNNDSIQAGGGNDTIGAGLGDDTVDAGDGDDVVYAETGNDSVIGGQGNDSLFGEAGADTLEGGIGADSLDGGDDNDSLVGGAGSDTLWGQSGNDTLSGGDDADFVNGGLGDDLVEGGAGNDTLEGWYGNDTIYGGAGNDYIDADNDSDFVDAGDGDDTVVGGFSVSTDTIHGGAGNDSLDGQAGDDLIYGGTGNDIQLGAEGDDTFFIEDNFGADTITGGETDETDGDTLDLSATTTGVTVDLSNANPETGTIFDGTDTASFTEIENIVLGAGRDTVALGDGSGSDAVRAFDLTDSGDGTSNDQLDVSDLTSDGGTTPVTTADVVVTDTNGDGTGDAILTFPGGESITLVGVLASEVDSPAELESIGIPAAPDPNDNIVTGTNGDDNINDGYTDSDGTQVNGADALGTHGETIGSDADSITSGAGNDTVFAGAGDDTVDGGTGDDALYGNGGDDSIVGGAGDDRFQGDTGNDTLDGGADADRFDQWRGEGNDTVIGGETGNDVDTLWTIDAVDGVDVTFTGDEAGVSTHSDGTGTTFTEIEQIYGSGLNDTIDGAASNATMTVLGNQGDDEITGGGAGDSLSGDDGNDTIDGGAGNDTISGGDNDDVVSGGLGNDDIHGNGGHDTLYGNAGADTLEGASGDDQLYGGDGDDTVLGGTGSDYLSGGIGADSLVGGDGNDDIDGGDGNDTISGGADNDNIDGDAGNDSISGGTGNDSMWGGAGNDTLVGGDGDDAIYANTGDDSVNAGAGTDYIQLESGNDTVTAGDDADNIGIIAGSYADGAVVTVDGGTGGVDNDSLTLTSWSAFRNLTQSPDEDTDSTSGSVEVQDASGNWITVNFAEIETLSLPATDLTPDYIVEGTAAGDLITGLYTGDPEGDMVDNNDHSDGSNDDLIYGFGGDDVIQAADGNDTAYGGVGDDQLYGGDGNDYLDGGADDDDVYGGIGDDTLLGGDGNDSIFASTGADSIDAGAGDDTIRFTENDTVQGGDGDDLFRADALVLDGSPISITGGEGGETTGDTLYSGTYNGDITVDLQAGGTGADPESGTMQLGTTTVTFDEIENVQTGTGDDNIIGSDGNDNVSTGAGADTVDGGAGDDTFDLGSDTDRDTVLFADGDGQDTVANFDMTDSGDGTTVDQLNVSGLTSDGGTTPVNTADVVVTDTNGDGTGDAILTFPGGESITLVGIAPTQVDTAAELASIGIPMIGDFVVEGDGGANLIDINYVGDPDGDMIDNNDHSDGSNDDSVTAGAGNDTVHAGAGNDSVDGGTGADEIYGDGGNDLLDGGANNDTLYGGEGNDTVLGGTGDDSIESWIGDDSLVGGDGNDYLDAAQDNDTLIGGAGNDTLLGGSGAGDDSLDGGAGDDSLSAGDGEDTLVGGEGDDSIFAGGGDDIIILEDNFGNDTIDGRSTGETDGDTLDLTGVTAGVTLDLTAADPEAGTVTDVSGTATFSEIENIILSSGRDRIELADGGGNDTVNAFDMTDSGDGSTNDQLNVSGLTSDGGTTPVNTADVVVTDTNGDGTGDAILTFPGGESITLVGVSPTQVDTPAELQSIGIPRPGLNFIVEGTAGADVINSTYADDPEGDMINNNDHSDGSNDDSVEAGDGNDTVHAGTGNDTVLGEAGNDSIFGNDGNDFLQGGGGNDALDGDAGDDSILGGAGSDTIVGDTGNDTLRGGDGDDEIYGSFDSHLITGDAGNDQIFAGDGNDTISGGGDDDTIISGAGDDSIDGGTGDDRLTGDAGDDFFGYNAGDGADTITDFNAGNSGTLDDGDSTNNDFVDLSGFYDHISELYADQADDGVLNQSNATDTRGNTTDYSDNTQFGAGSLTLNGVNGDSSDLTDENTGVVCFTSGTTIRTPQGDVKIDDLKIGDLVTTLDNGDQPIRWIGTRHLNAAELAAAPNLRPVRIKRGVLGATRNLLVSQQHGMLVGPDHLVRAVHLAGSLPGVRIANHKKSVTYVHLMFDAHQIIFAEGAPSESFFPGPMALNATAQDARAELFALFPELCNVTSLAGAEQLYGQKARTFLNRDAFEWAYGKDC